MIPHEKCTVLGSSYVIINIINITCNHEIMFILINEQGHINYNKNTINKTYHVILEQQKKLA